VSDSTLCIMCGGPLAGEEFEIKDRCDSLQLAKPEPFDVRFATKFSEAAPMMPMPIETLTYVRCGLTMFRYSP